MLNPLFSASYLWFDYGLWKKSVRQGLQDRPGHWLGGVKQPEKVNKKEMTVNSNLAKNAASLNK